METPQAVSPPAKARKRRNLLSEPKFQFRFIRFLVLGALLQVVGTSAILYHFIRQNYLLLVRYAALDTEIKTLLFSELRVLTGLILLTFAAYFGVTVLLGIIYSHRIGGAIYAIKRTIRQINEGKDVELKLRKGDEFHDVAESFNEMVKKLKAASRTGDRKVG